MKISRLMISAMLLIFFISACQPSTLVPVTAQTAVPTEIPAPTMTPTATPVPYYVNATVWDESLSIPIVIYHRFVADDADVDATHMNFSEFKKELQSFYDAGFSLISLKDWLNGKMDVPPGRKPMILTLDDAWQGDQLYILKDGNPSKQSGLGVLWYFAQDHPDFGYHASVFAVYGDKYYPELQVGYDFYAADNINYYSKSWHVKLADTIAWAMSHGIEIYNHTFDHPWNWTTKDAAVVKDELEQNDKWLRVFLTEGNHIELIPQLGNIIALPEGRWPDSDAAKSVILNYKNPEGLPVAAVMAAFNYSDAQLTPFVFSDKFKAMQIQRIEASKFMTAYIIKNSDLVPSMLVCRLGPLEESQVSNLDYIQATIQAAVTSKMCAEGVYNVNRSVFLAKDGKVTLFRPAGSADVAPNSTPTITVTP